MTVEVPVEEIKPAIEKAYKDISKQVNIPGFRKGHVPARLIDQRFGRGVVYEQAVNGQMERLYQQAVVEANIHPLMAPSIEISELPAMEGPLTGNLVFSAEVCVRPEFEVPGFDGLDITVEPVKVIKADVDEALEDLRLRFASLKPVDRKAKKGDFVTIDLKAEINGEEIDSVSGVSYEIGSKNMLEGQDKAITGMASGETNTFTSKLEGGEHQGEEALITVQVTAIKEREIPAVDEEFAQMVSEFDTVDELREDLKKQATKAKEMQQAVSAREKVVEYLHEAVEFPTPAKLLEAEVSSRVEREGVKPSSKRGKEIAEQAEKAIREQIILDAVAEDLDVTVSQEELLNFIVEYAQQNRMDPSQFISQAAQSGQISMFMAMLAREKVIEIALRQAKITDGKKVIDLSEYLTPASAEAAEKAPKKPAGKVGAKKAATKKTVSKAGDEKSSAKKVTATKSTTTKAASEKKSASKRSTTKKEQ